MKLFQSKLVKIAFAYSVVCVFFHLVESGSPRKTLAGPFKKLKMIVLCSLKLVLIFQLDIQDICQIQYNSRHYNKLINLSKTMRSKHFQNSPSFKKMQGFKTKICVILDCLSFCNMLFYEKLKLTVKKQYIITDGMRWDVFYCYRKKWTHHQVFVNGTTK